MGRLFLKTVAKQAIRSKQNWRLRKENNPFERKPGWMIHVTTYLRLFLWTRPEKKRIGKGLRISVGKAWFEYSTMRISILINNIQLKRTKALRLIQFFNFVLTTSSFWFKQKQCESTHQLRFSTTVSKTHFEIVFWRISKVFQDSSSFAQL